MFPRQNVHVRGSYDAEISQDAFENRCILAQVIITNVRLSGAEQYTNHALRKKKDSAERRMREEEKGEKNTRIREKGKSSW